MNYNFELTRDLRVPPVSIFFLSSSLLVYGNFGVE